MQFTLSHSAVSGSAIYFEPDDTDGLSDRPLIDPRNITLVQRISVESGVGIF